MAAGVFKDVRVLEEVMVLITDELHRIPHDLGATWLLSTVILSHSTCLFSSLTLRRWTHSIHKSRSVILSRLGWVLLAS